MTPLFSGTTAACIKHFASKDFGDRKREVLAAFTKCSVNTVRRWSEPKGHLPIGEPLIRVRVYLEHIGYAVEEFQKLSLPIRQLARLIAFEVVTVDGVVEKLKLPPTHGRDQLFRFLKGDCGVSNARLYLIQQVIKETESMLQARQEQTEKLHLRGAHRSAAPETPKAVEGNPTPVVKTAGGDMVRTVLDHAITLANSLDLLMTTAGITPKVVLEGDRMRMRRAFKTIGDRLGINVSFSEPTKARQE